MSDRKRPVIAVLMEFPTALGGERSFISVAHRLRSEFDFCILAPGFGSLANELFHAELNHIPFSVRDNSGVRKCDEQLLAELETILHQQQCALLHANSVTLSRFVGRFREQFACPVTGHLRDIMQLSQKAISDLGQLDALIAVSQATADCYCEQGLPPALVQVVHNGIDVEEFGHRPAKPLHRELQLPAGSHFAAIIGQIGLRKGHDVLFNALAKFAEQFPNWHFLILGERYSEKIESRDFIRQLETTVRQAGLEQQVHWMGYLNEVPSILSQCDLLIHPARQEPFGRVLLEAAASEAAIITTRVGGTPEMLQDRTTALLVAPDNPDQLAEACQTLMADGNLRQQLARRAHHHVRETFPLSRSCDQHAHIWKQALTKKK